MSYTIQATTLLARGTEETQDKLLDLPRRDVFTVAPGFAARRVPAIQPTWDGQGAVPLGWSSYRGCPKCQARTLSSTTTTVTAATQFSTGLEETTLDCAHCGFHDVTRRVTPVLPPPPPPSSSSSRSGSSGGGSSFGGSGRTAGGGGGSSY
jgi:uncharacterized membrane protein YgcG